MCIIFKKIETAFIPQRTVVYSLCCWLALHIGRIYDCIQYSRPISAIDWPYKYICILDKLVFFEPDLRNRFQNNRPNSKIVRVFLNTNSAVIWDSRFLQSEVKIWIALLLLMTPCSLVDGYRRFWGTYYLYLQGRSDSSWMLLSFIGWVTNANGEIGKALNRATFKEGPIASWRNGRSFF